MENSRKCITKNAFSMLELIFVIFLLSLFSYGILNYRQINSLDVAVNRTIIYLKQTRLQAFINDKFDTQDSLWHKKRWTLKFFRCRSSVGGLYYVIYSDSNQTGHPSSNESLKDPLSNKNIYSSNSCSENPNNSKYVLLTQEYDISNVNLSCNNTTSLGQISFGSDGRVYSKLSSEDNEFYENEITEPCLITMTHKNGTSKSIVIENKTGFIYKKKEI